MCCGVVPLHVPVLDTLTRTLSAFQATVAGGSATASADLATRILNNTSEYVRRVHKAPLPVECFARTVIL